MSNVPIILSSNSTKIFSTNKLNSIESNIDNTIEADAQIREVIPKGYLLSQISLSTIPDIIQDAINAAMLSTKDQTLADALISTLRSSIDNLEDGIYKKTYIDSTMTYLENILISKVGPEQVAAITDAKIAIATADFAATSQVELLTSRIGNSESEISTVKETINTKDTARATQITEMEARINDTFAGYSEAVDLYVDENGITRASKIENLTISFTSQITALFDDITILQAQNDGVVETVSGSYDVVDTENSIIPLAEPYASWLATDTANNNMLQRQLHIGDVYAKVVNDEYISSFKFVKKEIDSSGADKTDSAGFTWVKITDTAVQEAIAKAILAQQTADGKIHTFYGPLFNMNVITSAWTDKEKLNNIGDIYYASDDKDKPYRWTGTSWLLIDDKEIGVLTASITETNELIATKDGEWKATSMKLITSPTGAITGYSFQDGSGLKSNFTINADSFKISNSTNTYTPFLIVNNSIAFNGKVSFSNTTSDTGESLTDVLVGLETGLLDEIIAENADRLLAIANLDGKIDTKESELINSINSETQTRINEVAALVVQDATLDGKITTAEQNRIDAIDAVSLAYKNYSSVMTKAMADGILTADEQALIADALDAVNLAKARFENLETGVSNLNISINDLNLSNSERILEIANLDGKIDTKESELINSINSETQNRINEVAALVVQDATLDGKITTAEQNRIDAIDAVSLAYKNYSSVMTKAMADGILTADEQALIANALDAVNLAKARFENLEEEASNLSSSVTAINTTLSSNAIQIANLDGKIDTKESELINSINAEASTRAAAITARINAEALLDGKIDTEEAARIASANALTIAYTNYTNTVKQALIDGEISTAEQSAIDAAAVLVNTARTNLQNQINGLTKVEDISWQSEVQAAVNNNTFTVDGGKIVANTALVNNLNALGGITADTITLNKLKVYTDAGKTTGFGTSRIPTTTKTSNSISYLYNNIFSYNDTSSLVAYRFRSKISSNVLFYGDSSISSYTDIGGFGCSSGNINITIQIKVGSTILNSGVYSYSFTSTTVVVVTIGATHFVINKTYSAPSTYTPAYAILTVAVQSTSQLDISGNGELSIVIIGSGAGLTTTAPVSTPLLLHNNI